jgi:DNA-binding response OmpR family regulator
MRSASARILSIGYDAAVFDSRNRVLESAGFRIAACLTPERATELFVTEAFDAVVLCDSLPTNTRSFLMRALRGVKPTVPILMVYQVGEVCDDIFAADAAVESLDGPERLIQAVFSLLHKPAQSHQIKPSFKQSAG